MHTLTHVLSHTHGQPYSCIDTLTHTPAGTAPPPHTHSPRAHTHMPTMPYAHRLSHNLTDPQGLQGTGSDHKELAAVGTTHRERDRWSDLG